MNESPSTIRRMFTALVRRREERIDLGLAALLIAKEEYPSLAVEDYVERLDQLAAGFQVELPVGADALTTCRALARFLAGQHGYGGDRDSYYDPRNSYLSDVMDRCCGIPITLSVLYIEVARRARVTLSPVSFPAHFLIKHASDQGDVYIDPFNEGRIIDLAGCRELFARSYGDALEFSASLLGAATKRQVITRMLLNLKAIYGRAQDFERALRTLELLIAVSPWDLDQLRDRGFLYARLGRVDEAVADLTSFTQYAPSGPEVDAARSALHKLTGR